MEDFASYIFEHFIRPIYRPSKLTLLVSEPTTILLNMATDLSADEGLPKNPNMEYAELLFVLQSPSATGEEKKAAEKDLMKAIEDNSK